MEIHFMIGENGSGKSQFIDTYFKNEHITNGFHLDFKKIFAYQYDSKSSEDNRKINELISLQQTDGKFFIELSIESFRKFDFHGFTLESISRNIKESSKCPQNNIYVHFFDKDEGISFSGLKCHNIVKHNFIIMKNGSYYDHNFDWNILHTKKYNDFKMKYNYFDFEKLHSSYTNIDDGRIDSGYNQSQSITNILSKIENFPNVSWIVGKKLEDEARLTVIKNGFSFYDGQFSETIHYFSIPHLVKFLRLL